MTRKAGEEVASPAFYAQGCVKKLTALLHAPRAASREDESSLLDCYGEMHRKAYGRDNTI